MSEEDGYVSPSMMNDVRNAIAKGMADNGTEEKPGALESLPTPNIENVTLKYSNLMNEDTVEALQKSAVQTVKLNDDGTISQVRYLGKKVKKENEADAAKFVVDRLNELAAANLIEGALLPLAALEIGDEDIAVLSYVMLTADGVQLFDEQFNDVRVEEGGDIQEL